MENQTIDYNNCEPDDAPDEIPLIVGEAYTNYGPHDTTEEIKMMAAAKKNKKEKKEKKNEEEKNKKDNKRKDNNEEKKGRKTEGNNIEEKKKRDAKKKTDKKDWDFFNLMMRRIIKWTVFLLFIIYFISCTNHSPEVVWERFKKRKLIYMVQYQVIVLTI